MKVLVNQLTALRQKAGMGHYISQLVRCLPLQAGADQVLLYPGPCTKLGLTLGSSLLALGKNRKSKSQKKKTRSSPLAAWARKFQAWHFQTFGARKNFDLYHEPNYIALPCDRPTIITVADLSLLLHPHWHPVERARH